jgi:hypothetical protein
LTEKVIIDFPVSGHGQRNDQMVRATASLLGRGYDLGLVQGAVEGWWGHDFEKGVIRTPPSEAPREARACIAAITRSPKFTQSVGVARGPAPLRIGNPAGPCAARSSRTQRLTSSEARSSPILRAGPLSPRQALQPRDGDELRDSLEQVQPVR